MNNNASLWRNRSFVLVWAGQSLSMFGSRLTYIALLWWVLEKTGSAAALAGVAIATALPTLFLGPIAGVFIDRLDRRKLMLAMNLVNGLIIGAAATLLLIGLLQIWEIYVFTILASTATLFHRPSLQSSIPNLVPGEQLTKANSLYQISSGAAGIAGPALGGILVGMIGSGPTMWVDAFTFLIAAISLVASSFPSPRMHAGRGLSSVLSDIATGFRFLYDRKALFFMLLLFALINFVLAPTSILFPIMAKDVLHTGARGFGLFGSALSVGMVAGGLLTARLRRLRRRGMWIIAGLILLGTMLSVFGLSRGMMLSLVSLGLVGLSVAVVNIIEAVIFQTRVPNELQGRVFAAQSAITDGLQPISLAATGAILTLVAAPGMIIVCGAVAAIAGLGGLAVRGMRDL
ncbi:MAG TPA: MFS transporter [Candidatus Acetothermia bacterium]|nr:MFS transporter [Candidatus Acetothermia bacterium]